ncbi:hypothetical protein ACFX1Z_037647 [Malus domestica]
MKAVKNPCLYQLLQTQHTPTPYLLLPHQTRPRPPLDQLHPQRQLHGVSGGAAVHHLSTLFVVQLLSPAKNPTLKRWHRLSTSSPSLASYSSSPVFSSARQQKMQWLCNGGGARQQEYGGGAMVV